MLGTAVTITETFSVLGTPTDPTTVTFYVRDPSKTLTEYVFGVDTELTNPSVGVYVLQLDALTLPGHYNYRAEGTGAVIAACEGDFDILPSPTLTITPQGLEYGPCTSWIDGSDVAECCDAEVGSYTSLFDESAASASQLLYELSGRVYAGICERTVRPCSNQNAWCGQVLSRGHLVGWEDGWNGGGGWRWDDGNSCGCRPLDRVLLSGYPVTNIVEVKINGDIVDPDTYRLDERRYLTRVRDPAEPEIMLRWPACQDLDLGDDQDGTFSVTYEYGAQPPLIAREAAKQLACQLYLACVGSESCQLPQGVTKITRQGLTIERTFFARDIKIGAYRTGMTLVDTFLNAFNPSGLQRRPAVWSPDGPKYARPVGP